MIVTGVNMGLSNLVVEESDTLRAVDKLFDISHSSTYFEDRNPDRTNTPDFNRQLKERQKELQNAAKKYRDFLNSEDLKLVYEQMKGSVAGRLVDEFR